MKSIKRFLREEDGVTSLEYGLLAALLCVAIAAAATSLGSKISTAFNTVGSSL